MWPPPAVRTTSNRYENSSQTRLNMPRSTVLIAAVIRSFMSSKYVESDGMQTLSLTYPHKKKSHAVKPEDLAGRITAAINTVDRDMLRSVWGEISHHI